MPIAYAYIRVSHKKSEQSGLSPEAQSDRCRNYYEYRIKPEGVDYYDGPLLYDAAVSARHVPFQLRPAGRRLFEMVRPGDHVIFAYLDRGFRELSDYTKLIDLWDTMNVTVHFADLGVDLSTGPGRLVANIMASIAQGQSDLISERNKEIAARMRRLNRPLNGKKRLGYKLEGPPKYRQWVPDEIELSIMAEIVRLRDDQGMTWQEVSDKIEQDLCTHEGREFNPSVFVKRKWSWEKCRRGYEAFKRFLTEQAQRASDGTAITNSEPLTNRTY